MLAFLFRTGLFCLSFPVPGDLSWWLVLGVLFWVSCLGCPVLSVLSWVSCLGCPVLGVLSFVFCPGVYCPVPGVLSRVLCSGFPILGALSCVSFLRSLVPAVLSQQLVLNFLSWILVPACVFLFFCPGCLRLSCQSCPALLCSNIVIKI
jgi:hypothetical protein